VKLEGTKSKTDETSLMTSSHAHSIPCHALLQEVAFSSSVPKNKAELNMEEVQWCCSTSTANSKF